MTQQIDIYGVLVPTLGVLALAAFVLFRAVSRVLVRFGIYRFIWHRPLFDFALYVSVLSASLLFIQGYHWS